MTAAGLLGAMSARSTLGAGLAVTAVLAIASWFIWHFVYEGFVAVAVHENGVRLSFIWPRPSRVFNPNRISGARVFRDVSSENDMSIPLYRIELNTTSGDWISQPTSHRALVDNALAMVEAARAE